MNGNIEEKNGGNVSDSSKGTVALLRFPAKVYEAVTHCDTMSPDVASWDEEGEHFIIYDRTAFEKTYLVEKYWGSQNGDILFASFQRQLTSYGFKKVNNKRGWNKKTTVKKSLLVYHHENFKKGHPLLLEKIEIVEIPISSKKGRSQILKKNTHDNDFQRMEGKIDELNTNYSQLNGNFEVLLALMQHSQKYSKVDKYDIDRNGRPVSPVSPSAEVNERKTISTKPFSTKEVPSSVHDRSNAAFYECFEPLPYDSKVEIAPSSAEDKFTHIQSSDRKGASNSSFHSTSINSISFDLEAADISIFDDIGSNDTIGNEQNKPSNKRRKRQRMSSLSMAMLFAMAMVVCAISVASVNYTVVPKDRNSSGGSSDKNDSNDTENIGPVTTGSGNDEGNESNKNDLSDTENIGSNNENDEGDETNTQVNNKETKQQPESDVIIEEEVTKKDDLSSSSDSKYYDLVIQDDENNVYTASTGFIPERKSYSLPPSNSPIAPRYQ